MRAALALGLALAALAAADLPVHCLKWNVLGNWTFKMSAPESGWTARTCLHTRPDNVTAIYPYTFSRPGFDTFATGTFTLHDNYSSNATLCLDGGASCEDAEWTMVYDEGMAIYGTQSGTELVFTFVYTPRVASASFSEPSLFESYCGETYTGWYTASGQAKGCAVAINDAPVPSQPSASQSGTSQTLGESVQQMLRARLDAEQSIVGKEHVDFKSLAEHFNKQRGSSWVADASAASVFHGMSEEQILQFYGGERTKLLPPKSFSLEDIDNPDLRAQEELRRECVRQVLPPSRDWSTTSYSTRVVNQGDCGSCYAISAADAMTMRYRIAMGHSSLPSFSAQHILRCSAQNQGCAGGYPWLVSYFGGHEGLLTETCPGGMYTGSTEPREGAIPACDLDVAQLVPRHLHCNRTFVTNYGYVGGYYGRGNAADMMWSLERDGPLVVAVNPGQGFSVYRKGLFVAGLPGPNDIIKGKRAYWEKTTHAVVLVGYGSMTIDGIEVPTWKLKNSWGVGWGDDGYFTIQRGVDALAVESMPVHFSFLRNKAGNPGFEAAVRQRLASANPNCTLVIESMLATGFL